MASLLFEFQERCGHPSMNALALAQVAATITDVLQAYTQFTSAFKKKNA